LKSVVSLAVRAKMVAVVSSKETSAIRASVIPEDAPKEQAIEIWLTVIDLTGVKNV